MTQSKPKILFESDAFLKIRVHLASIGHPIVADHLYAPDRASILGFERPALHALSVSFEGHTFSASLPPDFPS